MEEVGIDRPAEAARVTVDAGRLSPIDRKAIDVSYVVAVRRRKYLPLTELEEAEFQKAMFGREETREQAPDTALLLQRKLNPQE